MNNEEKKERDTDAIVEFIAMDMRPINLEMCSI